MLAVHADANIPETGIGELYKSPWKAQLPKYRRCCGFMVGDQLRDGQRPFTVFDTRLVA